jgi:transposase InsO family protein
VYRFVKCQQKECPAAVLCRTLGTSRSGYYGWLSGKAHQKNEREKKMEASITATFMEHKRRYGSRRIAATLQSEGHEVTRYRAGAVLRKNGLKAIQPRSFVPKTTDSRHTYAISPNLLLDRPLPQMPNETWVGDITYIPLAAGNWAYLAVWMDLYSRKIIGWHIDTNMQESLVVAAFGKAVKNREKQKGTIAHSDSGGQYAGKAFRKMLDKNHFAQSMGRADNPYDNAFMESCFSRFKAELLQDGIFENLEDARTEIFEYIEMYYNTKRLHSSLNYQSPDDYEKRYFYSLKQRDSMSV